MDPRAWVVSNHVPGDPTSRFVTLFQLHDNEASARQAAADLGFKAMAGCARASGAWPGDDVVETAVNERCGCVPGSPEHLQGGLAVEPDLMPEFEGESPLQNIAKAWTT